MASSNVQRALLMGLFVSAALGVYLAGNNRVALWDRDEPRYANASRHMARGMLAPDGTRLSRDWVVPRWGFGTVDEANEPRVAKPPLIYWAQAGAMKLTGILTGNGDTAGAARLPSALAMTLTLAVIGVVLFRTIGARRAIWTVFVLGSAGMVVASAKMCVTDAVLLLFITVSQLCLASIRLGSRAAWVPLVMWVSVGLAGLTKGPVGPGVMVTTLIVLALFDRTGPWTSIRSWTQAIAWLKFTRPLLGVVIVTLVVGPWLYLVSQRSPGFLTQAISHDVINRMKSGLEGHKGPPGFYLLSIWGTYFPWSLLLPASIVIAWRHRHLPATRFALAAVIGPWVMMELVQTKLVHYVLPIFPALAFLTADAIVRCARRQYKDLETRSWVVATGVWGLIVIGLGLAPWAAMRAFGGAGVSLFGAAGFSGAAMLTGVLVFVLFRARRVAPACVVMGLGFFAMVGFAYQFYLPSADFLRLPLRVAKVLKLPDVAGVGPATRGQVFMIDYKEPSLAWYQDGTIAERDSGWLGSLPSHDLPKWVVLTKKEWDQHVSPDVQARYRIAGTESGLNYAGGGVKDVLVIMKK